MPRYRLTLEYDGGAFNGWQRLSEGPSVQAALEAAASALADGAPVDVTGAGRTDAGVHALGQVAHLDLPGDLRAGVLRDALNAHLRPAPIVVLQSARAADDFHARFDATARTYLYRILNRRPPPAVLRSRVWWFPRPLDARSMQAAADVLIGRHDFTTFRDSKCQAKSPVKTVDWMKVSRAGDEIHVRVGARSFLHRQVRSMVGTLAEAGLGKMSAADVAAALAAKNRARCGPVAPAEGLYLERVDYGEN